MRNEFTAIIEQSEGWFIAYSPEVPGANGQGRTKDEALESLRGAIELILEDRTHRFDQARQLVLNELGSNAPQTNQEAIERLI